jgi:hypothetical protein
LAGLVNEGLESRLRRLEDLAEIADLIARYGPAVDAGVGDELSRLWTLDGEYRIGADVVVPAAHLPEIVDFETHREYLAAGCAHVLSPPRVEFDGDRAVAVNHSVVFVRRGLRWEAERVSANRWELQRTIGGWRVMLRENHLLDGDAAARALLAPPTL